MNDMKRTYPASQLLDDKLAYITNGSQNSKMGANVCTI